MRRRSCDSSGGGGGAACNGERRTSQNGADHRRGMRPRQSPSHRDGSQRPHRVPDIIADQLFRNPEHHKHVRKQVVKQLKHHRKSYEGYVPMKYKTYLKKMKSLEQRYDPVIGGSLLLTYTTGYIAPLLLAASFAGALQVARFRLGRGGDGGLWRLGGLGKNKEVRKMGLGRNGAGSKWQR
ncbi:hypothetical protein Syun_021001 [Stephania yunnanensis]|uniref:Uncharacterized protein n=1 Tax=Stephania yunnanensis TaxID=152371 RepID=A0AAP0NQ93_9MAGN